MEAEWVGEVLDFWFRELGAADWFAKNVSVDARIRQRFLQRHAEVVASSGSGISGPRPALAAVIVLDQFSRHLFRNRPEAYAADPLARRLARDAIARGDDGAMTDHERLFLYLPFEHSEDPEDQALAVTLIGQLRNDDWTRSALAHKAIVDRFGRFPHRNEVLGRISTAEELALLQDPMGSF
jgi:uncharacterized protein (DUF924 family)